MAPFPLALHPGTVSYFLVFLLIGIGFGAVLELSGFGDSRRLAAQFYMRDMTVLKVMFTAIIVAAVLVHLSSAFGLLDLSRVWINPTYLLPGIAGGLIMGVGFIIGGFCPGTSLVAASTLKLDGVWFVLGGLAGVFLFGETVGSYDGFWHSSFMGRFTLAEWLGLPPGLVVLLVVLTALAMFYGAEVSEHHFGRGRSWREVPLLPRGRVRVLATVSLLLLAGVAALQGQPGPEDRWRWMARDGQRLIAERAVYVDPLEVVSLRRDLNLRVVTLEVRSEEDYNLFHLQASRRISLEEARGEALAKELRAEPDNAVLFLVSNSETAATEAWKLLRAQNVLNLYVISGGINHWLDHYSISPEVARRVATEPDAPGEPLRYRFFLTVGDRVPAAHPDRARPEIIPVTLAGAPHRKNEDRETEALEPAAERPLLSTCEPPGKVMLQKKAVARGGCG